MPTDAPLRIVLTGASQGLGLEFTRLWLEAGHQICAMARSASASPGLGTLVEAHGDQLHLIDLDITDDNALAAAAATLSHQWHGVDVLLNNAGVYPAKGDSLADLDPENWRRAMEVNALGPLRVTRALLPLLRRGNAPKVVNMTSLMGSITDNSSGGSWAYRMSKTALNMGSRNMAHELAGDGITAVVLHPGWVQTQMGGAGAPLSIHESEPPW